MKRTCSNFTRDSSGLQVGHYCTLLDGPVMTETQLCLSTAETWRERRSVFPALFSILGSKSWEWTWAWDWKVHSRLSHHSSSPSGDSPWTTTTCDKKRAKKGSFYHRLSVCSYWIWEWVQSPFEKYLDTFVSQNIRPKLLKLGMEDKEFRQSTIPVCEQSLWGYICSQVSF